jgi:hypothetical protein
MPSCVNAVTPSSSPTSSAILPFSIQSTVVPVKCIFRPDAAGSAPARKSLNDGPVWVPPPFPPTDDIISLGDEIGSAPELEVRKGGAEIEHEIPHFFATPTRSVQRILEQHVRGGELVNDLWVPRISPEPLEPASNEGLVFLFTCHPCLSRCSAEGARVTLQQVGQFGTQPVVSARRDGAERGEKGSIDLTPAGEALSLSTCTSTPGAGGPYTRFLRFDSAGRRSVVDEQIGEAYGRQQSCCVRRDLRGTL